MGLTSGDIHWKIIVCRHTEHLPQMPNPLGCKNKTRMLMFSSGVVSPRSIPFNDVYLSVHNIDRQS